jgi:hypothetical protein
MFGMNSFIGPIEVVPLLQSPESQLFSCPENPLILIHRSAPFGKLGADSFDKLRAVTESCAFNSPARWACDDTVRGARK